MAEANEITSTAPARPLINPWIVAITVTLATFMEVLDSSIANVALPHIAGTLGASSEESTWVITSYLVSSAIVLPMSGWLSNVIGRKRFYMIVRRHLHHQLVSLCSGSEPAHAHLLPHPAGRGRRRPAAQRTSDPGRHILCQATRHGLCHVWNGGGGRSRHRPHAGRMDYRQLQLALDIPHQRAHRHPFARCSPQRLVHDPAYLRNMVRSNIRVDYIGISLIVVGVGFLQYVLDKGEENDWFSSKAILVSLIIAIVALVALVIRELTHKNPIMDLRLLGKRNFATAVTFSFILGMVLNGSTILLPQFLQNDLGYTAQQAGMALSPGGIALAFMMPIAGILASKFDPRVIIAIGFALTSFGLFHVTNIYLGVSFSTMVTYRVIQVIGIPLIFIPISTLNYVGVPRNKFNQVSGISNFMRNIGGAIGVSMLNNFITRQGQIHRTALTAHTNHANPFFERQLNAMTQNFIAMGASASEASHRALAQLSAQVDLQANVLGFVNSFWVLGLLVMFLVPLPFIMRRPSAEEAKAAAAAH